MNGKELMESMGYVDEKYIAEAEDAPPKRRIHWQPLAAAVSAAACLTLVLVGVWQFRPQKLTENDTSMVSAALYTGEAASGGTARSVEETAADQAVGAAPMMVSALAEMTVQVVERTADGLVCIVTDPGTSDFQPNDQVTIALPGATEAASVQAETDVSGMSETEELNAAQASTQADTGDSSRELYLVTFLPDQDAAVITPAQWTPVPQE